MLLSTGSLTTSKMASNSGLTQMVSKCKRDSKTIDSPSSLTNLEHRTSHGIIIQWTQPSPWETSRRMAAPQMMESKLQLWMRDRKQAQPLSRRVWLNWSITEDFFSTMIAVSESHWMKLIPKDSVWRWMQDIGSISLILSMVTLLRDQSKTRLISLSPCSLPKSRKMTSC